MQIAAELTPLGDVQADWLVVGIWETAPTVGLVAELDERLNKLITRLRGSEDATGKSQELTPIYSTDGINADRLLLVGLGRREAADLPSLFNAFAAAGHKITTKACKRVAIVLPEDIKGLNLEEIGSACGVGFCHGSVSPGLRKRTQDRFQPEAISLVAPKSGDKEELDGIARRVEIESNAVALARELVNTPPCDLYPESFAERAQEVARDCGVECEIFDQKRLEAERMGSLLGVARGSDRPPRLVLLSYRGGQGGKTLALVGKGVTFDSGGLSLKSNEQMLDMKCDMAGAATVLAAVKAIAEERLAVNVLGVMALVENLPSGKAMKLGDVLHARNGKTIEVMNTDAEGRLILADALSYAVDQGVNHIVDLATLTGACMVALGSQVAGLMTNDDAWSDKVLRASHTVGERVWPLPMYDFYGEMF